MRCITLEYRLTTGFLPRKLFAQPLSARIVRFKETFANSMRIRASHEAVQLICTCLLCIGHTLYTQLCPCNVDHASSSPVSRNVKTPRSLCRTGTREKRRSKEVSLDTRCAQIKDASTIVPFSLSTLFLELAAPVDASFHALRVISYVSHYTSFVQCDCMFTLHAFIRHIGWTDLKKFFFLNS